MFTALAYNIQDRITKWFFTVLFNFRTQNNDIQQCGFLQATNMLFLKLPVVYCRPSAKIRYFVIKHTWDFYSLQYGCLAQSDLQNKNVVRNFS